ATQPGDFAPAEGSRLDDLPDEIADARADARADADAEPAEPEEVDPLSERREEFLRVRERLDEELTNILDTLEGVDIRSIGVVGVLLFIYGATALLVTIEDSFNAVFGTTEGRPWYVRLPLYYTMITLGPVVLVGAQVLQNQLLGTLEVRDWTNWLVTPLAFLAPILASWMVLFLLYLLMPNASVSKQAAAVGGFVAAVLWVITKDIFQLYVAHGVMGSLYGALALVPLFLLWLWTAWLIVLFGLELTYTLQAMRGRYLKHQIHKQPEDDAVVDAAVMVPLATRLAAAFERGETVSLTELGQAANLPPRIVRKMMEMLESAHIVLRVQDTVGQSYSLARPAAKIHVDEILAAAEELLPSHEAMTSTEDAKLAWHFVDKLHDATHRIAHQRTLASLTHEERPTPR
ncbi:MAG: YhjD/YihY/BrkB family envelope integrity protein, partial [Phycisphaeraceae bacterium]